MGNCREVEIGERTLVIYEHEDVIDASTGKELAGSWIWDSSLVLAQWLGTPACPPSSFHGKTLVELGAGTGIPGLVAAVLGANVVLTDIPALLPGLQKNVDENELGEIVKVKALIWGEDCSDLSPPVDFILMSDLLYDVNAMPALCRTLKDLSDDHTQILLAYELRFGTTECFKAIREEGFKWARVPQEDLHPDWKSEDIGIFRLFRQN
eukprot:Gb_01624 [translate_table: standard]